MEIAVLSDSGLRVKGKHASIGIDPEKGTCNAVLLLHRSPKNFKLDEGSLLIVGPGEYEVGGVKISGYRADGEDAYSANVDGVDILFGKLESLEKLQHKLREFNLVVALCEKVSNAAFLTALSSNGVILYGESARQVAESFSKESAKSMSKYSVTADKLPLEVETIILE